MSDAFADAMEVHRRELRLHCYRMLGSSHDTNDVVQETLLRAWRARDSLTDPARLRPWLYRIATNACLDELAQRPRRILASELAPTADPARIPDAPIDEALWLEPMPDAWLAGGSPPDPEARYTLRQSVALAFIAALQVLSPGQRAALLLRDVAGLSAEETATALEQTVPAINSALHRARVAIDEKVGDAETYATTPADAAALVRYTRAIAEADLEQMLALLHDEIHTTMPPSPTWIAGRAANEIFYRRMFASWQAGDVRVVPLGANAQPGFALHRAGAFRAVELVEIRDGLIHRMHHFMQPALLALFVPSADTG